MKRKFTLRILLTSAILSSVLAGYTEPGPSPGSVEVSDKFIPGTVAGQGPWVLGSVMVGYTNSAYCPIFIETFDDYAPGPLLGQGPWVRNTSFSAFHDIDKIGPVVSAGEDQHASGTVGKDTAATCFFPDIFADGNKTGRIEFDFRRGALELDIRLGPAILVSGVASNLFEQSIGGQYAGYNGGCFTPFYKGGYNNPQIIYRPWQPGTFYHMVMDFAKTGTVVTVTTQVDGVPLANLTGPIINLTATQGLNSLTIRGADTQAPVHGIDNIKVSIPFKQAETLPP